MLKFSYLLLETLQEIQEGGVKEPSKKNLIAHKNTLKICSFKVVPGKIELFLYQEILCHGSPHKRRTMVIVYFFKYCSLNYQKVHQIFENISW